MQFGDKLLRRGAGHQAAIQPEGDFTGDDVDLVAGAKRPAGHNRRGQPQGGARTAGAPSGSGGDLAQRLLEDLHRLRTLDQVPIVDDHRRHGVGF